MLTSLNKLNLKQAPFEATPDTRFFYESSVHGEALARLLYLTSDRGMHIGVLTGQIGAGKSIVLNVLKEQLPSDRYKVVHIHTAGFPFENLMEEATTQLSGGRPLPPEYVACKYRLFNEFETIIKDMSANCMKHVVIMLDEAQMLLIDCLEELKCLTNMSDSGQCPVTLLLVGQNELKANLQKLPQVYQRIGMIYQLPYLEKDDILAYLNHRLAVAGMEDITLFSDDCVESLFNYTQGCPREINKVCKLAVDQVSLLGYEQIGKEMIDMVIKDIRKQFS